MRTKYKTKDRRKHGCDGCRRIVPTQKFEGYCNDDVWLCGNCFEKLVKEGLKP